MLCPIVKALLGHYRRHPLQLLLVWLGLTLGIATFVGVAAVNQHAKESYTHGERLFSNPLPYHIRTKHNANKIPQGLYIQLRREGFHQCVPVDLMRIETKSGQDLSVVAIDSVAMFEQAKNLNYGSFSSLQMLKQPYPIMMSAELASYLSIKNQDYIQLSDGSEIGPVLVDKSDSLQGTRIIMDIAKLRTLGRTGGFSVINCGSMSEQKLQRLQKMLPSGLKVSRNSRAELESLTQAFHMNLTAMGMLAFIVGMFIFYQAMSLSMVQRQPLVGILRQTGVSAEQLAKAMFIELSGFIFIGWLCGNALGLILANMLIPTVSTTLADLYGADVGLSIQWNWVWGYKSFAMAVIGALLACSWPLVRLLNAQPIRLAARLSLVRFAGKEFIWQALVAWVCFVCAIGLYFGKHSPETGFALVGFLLIGVALLVPFLIYWLFNWFSYSLRRVKVRWFFADAAASMSYRGVALMALLMAMSANIAVETLVGSFRETTDQWLTQRLAADLYIYPTNSSAARISNWLKTQDEVKGVWWRWEEDLPLDKGRIQVVSTGNSDGERKAITTKLAIPDYWYHLHHSRSVLISESMALKEKIRPGDHISFSAPVGDGWLVTGIYYDYGNPYNQMIMSHRNWLSILSGHGNVALGIHLKEGVSSEDLVRRLSNTYHLSADRVFNNTNIHSQAMRVFDRTFVIANTLGDLTLAIAIFGVFFATVAGEVSKQRQIALLRCFGITGKELIGISSLQLLLFGVLSASFAIPLGYIVADIMVDVVIKQSFGWSIQVHVIPWKYVQTFAGTLAALIIAGAIPLIGLIKRSPIKSLRDAL